MPACRALRHRRAARSPPSPDQAIRPAALPEAEGPQRPSHRGAKALYSVPGNLIGRYVDVRADSELVKISYRGQVVKIHPRQPPGGHSTDREDLPAGKSIYALRDLDRLREMAASHGVAIGGYAAVLLDNPLPWTKMRQVYALLGLVKKWGPERVEAACERAAAAEAYNVSLIGRMIDRAAEAEPDQKLPLKPRGTTARFVRPAEDFRIIPAKSPAPESIDDGDRAADANTAGAWVSDSAVMP